MCREEFEEPRMADGHFVDHAVYGILNNEWDPTV
jgi:hypothetical protein